MKLLVVIVCVEIDLLFTVNCVVPSANDNESHVSKFEEEKFGVVLLVDTARMLFDGCKLLVLRS